MQSHPIIHLVSAIACRNAYDDGEHFIIEDPMAPAIIPSANRGTLPITITVPPFVLVLTMYGGRTVGTVRLRFTGRAASGEYGLGEEVSFDWPVRNLWHRQIVPVQRGEFYMAEEGDFIIGILANGEPLGHVAIPFLFDDSL